MVPTNDFLPFCPTDTGSNLLSESDYNASTGRTSGNVPGVASSKLNNKALRQATYITAAVAQMTADQTNTDVLDDATPAKILAQIKAALTPIPRVVTVLSSGSGTYQPNYFFFTAAANATAGATYTNNGFTFTVVKTIAGAALLQATGTGAPTNSGTLTKASGTGDATIAFYAMRAPQSIRVRAVGGGGGGNGSASNGNNGGLGGAGGNTTFGTTLINAGGGGSGTSFYVGGNGGSASLGTGPAGVAFGGGQGTGANVSAGTADVSAGGHGGSSAFGGAGGGGGNGGVGLSAAANTGSGGGGGASVTGGNGGGGGGSGGFVEGTITNGGTGWSATYPWAIGSGGSAGAAGPGGIAGGPGASGVIIAEDLFS